MIQIGNIEVGVGCKRDLTSLRAKLVVNALFLTRNRADAEDLVQCAFIRAFERRERLDPDTNMHAWLRTVIRRLGVDLARQRRRRGASGRQELDGLVAPNPDPRPAWDWVSEEQLARALETCDEPYRELLKLHYGANLRYAEIADRLQLPMGTVATRLHRGRAMLRERLEALCVPPSAAR